MPSKPVDDISNSEMEFRLARIISDMIIMKHVAEHLKDNTLKHRVKEIQQALGGTISFLRRKYGIRLGTNTYKEE